MQRRALLIGINNYATVDDLQGCVNDVTNLRFILKQFGGFRNEDIRVLTDARATRRAILQRLKWLVRGASADDRLILHFSGHGSQIRDRGEQDELRDGLDELICPFDMDWFDSFITDDELMECLSVPDETSLEVVLDCCHSGDGDVEVSAAPAIALSSPGRVGRFLTPPIDIISRHEGDALAPTRRLFRARTASNLILWSACADFQTAADAKIGGMFHGAFTFFLCQHLRENQGRISRSELLRRVRASLRQDGYSQVPELVASALEATATPFALDDAS